MDFYRARLERTLGISVVLVIAAIVVLPIGDYFLQTFFNNRWLVNSSGDLALWFFLGFFIGTPLNILVLMWPYLASGAHSNAVLRLLHTGLTVVLIFLVILVTSTVYLPGLIAEGYSRVLFTTFLWALVLVFVIQHVFLFQVFMKLLKSVTAYLAGAAGFAALAFWFLFSLIPDRIMSSLLDFLVMADARQTNLVELYGVFFGMMLYFFIALLPWYLISFIAKKDFKVSPWMNIVYFYSGIIGMVGYISTVYYLM